MRREFVLPHTTKDRDAGVALGRGFPVSQQGREASRPSTWLRASSEQLRLRMNCQLNKNSRPRMPTWPTLLWRRYEHIDPYGDKGPGSARTSTALSSAGPVQGGHRLSHLLRRPSGFAKPLPDARNAIAPSLEPCDVAVRIDRGVDLPYHSPP